MKKLDFKSLLIGILIGAIGLSTAFAATTLTRADFNQIKIFVNDTQIDLKNQPMASIYKDEEINPRTYMPVRTILESMGYGVAWDGDVWVFSKEYLTASDDWVAFTDLQTIMQVDPRINCFEYLEDRHVVHAYWDVKYHWDIPTAVAGQDIYVKKSGVDYMLDLRISLCFDDYTPERIAELKAQRAQLVTITELWAVLEKQEGLITESNGMTNKLQAIFDNEAQVLNMFFDGEFIGVVERVLLDVDMYTVYVKKADINPYLEKYGLEKLV